MTWADRISPCVRSIPPSGIRRFFDIAAEMDDVISLGVGEPDFITPWHIRESCIYSLHRGYTSYTSNFGLLELRELGMPRLGIRERSVPIAAVPGDHRGVIPTATLQQPKHVQLQAAIKEDFHVVEYSHLGGGRGARHRGLAAL